MSAIALLRAIWAAGADLYVADGELRLRAPKGSMTPERKEAIRALKPQLLALVAAPVAVTRGVTMAVHFTFDRWQGIEAQHGRELADALLDLIHHEAAATRQGRTADANAIEDTYWAALEAAGTGNLAVALSHLPAGMKADSVISGGTSSPCSCCRSTRWWKLASGDHWVCATCHPPAKGLAVEVRHDGQALIAGTPEREPAPPPWPRELGQLIAMIAQLSAEDLPAAFSLRPGVRVGTPAIFLDRLREQQGLGPTSVWATQGLLQRDLMDLAVVAISQLESRASKQLEPSVLAEFNRVGWVDMSGKLGEAAATALLTALLRWKKALSEARDCLEGKEISS